VAAVLGLLLTVLMTPDAASAADPTGYQMVLQRSDGHLIYIDGVGALHDTQRVMAASTSPSAQTAYFGTIGSLHRVVQVAFQGSDGKLWIYNAGTNTPTPTNAAMAAGTSPSLTIMSETTVKVAFQGANGDLWTYTTGAGPTDTAQPMAPRTSPSQSGTDPRGSASTTLPTIAYQTSRGTLATLTADGVPHPTTISLAPGTSPSITAVTAPVFLQAGTKIAFQDSVGRLSYVNPDGSWHQTTFPMRENSSPFVYATGQVDADGTGTVVVSITSQSTEPFLVYPSLNNLQFSWHEGAAEGSGPTTILPLVFDQDGNQVGGQLVAFQGSDGVLWTTSGGLTRVGIPMAPGTSPVVFMS